MDDLTVSMGLFDQNSLLSDWLWLIGATRFPILLTAAGDAFLEDSQTGRVDFLDVQTASLHLVAASVDELRSLLADRPPTSPCRWSVR
jgi:hypothetical protein